MPELPEVETVKQGLERTILGKTVADVVIKTKKSFIDDPSLIQQVLVNSRVVSLARRAKVLLIGLSSGWTLAVHLKMTGQLIVVGNNNSQAIREKDNQSTLSNSTSVAFVGGHPEKVYEQPLPHKHTQVIVTFTDGTILYFNDLRKFGWMRLLRSNNNFQFSSSSFQTNSKRSNEKISIPTVDEFLADLNFGPEPLGPEFTVEHLENLVKKRSIPIKQLLLEQRGISGIGNIYADEALFRSGIHPARKAMSLQQPHAAKALRGKSEIEKLHKAIREVLELGIKHGGTSKNTYLTVEGTKGEMQDYLMVYQREDQPCRVCGTLIERIKIGQRSSHFCPKCQMSEP